MIDSCSGYATVGGLAVARDPADPVPRRRNPIEATMVPDCERRKTGRFRLLDERRLGHWRDSCCGGASRQAGISRAQSRRT
jgi:hypothetical protein